LRKMSGKFEMLFLLARLLMRAPSVSPLYIVLRIQADAGANLPRRVTYSLSHLLISTSEICSGLPGLPGLADLFAAVPTGTVGSLADVQVGIRAHGIDDAPTRPSAYAPDDI